MGDVNDVLRAFSAVHVQRLTGLSARQLRSWDNIGFFRPEFAFDNRRSPHSRIYSFKDVIGLRVLSILRSEHRLSLTHLRQVAKELAQYTKTPWSDLVLYVLNGQVCFTEPETGRIRGVISGQYACIPLETVIDEVRQRAERLKSREPATIGHIARHRHIAHNAWVVAGTRIPVNAIRRFSDAGYSAQQIVNEYPMLTEADVTAALAHPLKLTKAA